MERTQNDPEFRKEMLCHGIELMVSGDVVTGKHLLRDYINATVGFAKLAEALELSPKGIQRMLGPSGNPQANNLFRIMAYLQTLEGMHIRVARAAA